MFMGSRAMSYYSTQSEGQKLPAGGVPYYALDRSFQGSRDPVAVFVLAGAA